MENRTKGLRERVCNVGKVRNLVFLFLAFFCFKWSVVVNRRLPSYWDGLVEFFLDTIRYCWKRILSEIFGVPTWSGPSEQWKETLVL